MVRRVEASEDLELDEMDDDTAYAKRNQRVAENLRRYIKVDQHIIAVFDGLHRSHADRVGFVKSSFELQT